MNLLQSFKETITREKSFSPKEKLLLAVSGGMDSVVLCELCFQSGFDFILAHANFQLRGEQSEADEAFVRELARKYTKQVLVKRFDTEKYSLENKVSIQVAARVLRYEWFNQLISSTDPDSFQDSIRPRHILTAHHLDDNVETVLMNFFKGTGISGLRGIPSKQGRIFRPMLFAKKEEWRQFAMQAGLQWMEDSSNELDKYSRNYFRHQIIPLVMKIYPDAIGNLQDNIPRFSDIEILYHHAVDQNKKKLIEKRGGEIHIPVLKLKKVEALSTMVYEIIKEYDFTSHQVKEVIGLLDSTSGKYIQSPTHRIIRNREWLIIAPNDMAKAETILIEEKMEKVTALGFQVQFFRITADKEKKVEGITDPSIALLDADNIKFPLLLRKWKQGDYFYPLGMRKKKKIARFLIDNKFSQTEKAKVLVLEMDKKIIWVCGLRIDDRNKIMPSTKKILKIEMRMV